jgi:hypothetical protein
MKKWGLVVTLFFIAVVVALLVPATLVLSSNTPPSASDFRGFYQAWGTWICVGVVVLGQILLLWLKVDTTRRRLKPRTHILISVVTAGLFMAILTVDIVLAVSFGARGDKAFSFFDLLPESAIWPVLVSAFVIPWLVWGILFYRLWRNSSDPVTHAVAWLLRGSVLELLIAVPAHVIVRRRHDCSAPMATSFGITSGIAIMLIAFGPSVLLLYKKRMEKYSKAPESK